MGPEVLDDLFAVIKIRKGSDPETSYTARLFAKGRLKIAQKLGEEAVETALAGVAQGPDQLASESADLLYHLLVLWADAGVRPADVWKKLAERRDRSGIEEKSSRGKS
ncbi:MAG: phosphoribosyl-ATP diphosphatase [Alphaproteobacteria bacterium]|jgi:phosphoribosyl-ATP pyrophosphohydrolase|nr:phosphoribosyl-ATP diphosphatase [Alphaproteobacteria bacterium]MBF0356744.1 phosphoribosyl-ATP diphosphatase [Alphaproteobacteria bacterium]